MTMKAITYHRYGGPEVLEYGDVARPTAAEGQVLVRVHATSINAADYRLMRADPFLVRMTKGLRRPRLPILGVDVAGVIEAVGPGAQRFHVGDEVFGETPHGGCFAEYVAVDEDALGAKPEGISFEQAAAVPLAGVTALQGLRDKGEVAAGTAVLVQGAGGGVGTFAVQVATALGATVTAVCGPASADLMADLGADHVIDYTTEDFAASGRRYDVIVGINGHRSLGDYRRCLNPGGRYVMVGGANAQIFARCWWHRCGSGPATRPPARSRSTMPHARTTWNSCPTGCHPAA